MAYQINLKLPEGWISTIETYIDESGAEVTHLEANLPDQTGDSNQIMIDAYAGVMPDGETAEDQAFANYAEVIGFDEDDDLEESPIVKFKFNGKNAFGFDAQTEEGYPMRFFSQEVRKGVLLILACCARTQDLLVSAVEFLERNLRVQL
ncbi:MAG: hypothetical protein MJY48_00995 [Bacteroidales bacterium]|nr:hypothetical protein [Bacteroidales bacterium]